MLPAYTPNTIAAFFGNGTPIDFGKVLWDKQRILGDGKTYKGLFFGIAGGILTGIFQMFVIKLNLNFPSFGINTLNSLIVITAMAMGSLFGDILMSFFKRRLGFKRGAPFPIIDQLNFVFGAWVLTYLINPTWFIENFTPSVMMATLIISPILHITTNIIGYLLGIKKEPW